jgi:ferredoxin--NADP+ reductase
VFVAGWSREASSGLVGVARKDGENGARAVLAYLQSAPSLVDPTSMLNEFKAKLDRLNKPIIQKPDIKKLTDVVTALAAQSSLPLYRYPTNEEMLAAMGKLELDLDKRSTKG